MKKGLIAGALLFLGIVLVRAPAGLINLALDDNLPLTLLEPHGTLWSGNSELLFNGIAIGRLDWSFKPVTLISAAVGYDLVLTRPDIALDVALESGLNSQQAIVNGRVGASFVNVWLAPYDIDLGGEFRLNEVHIVIRDQRLEQTSGDLAWNGGPVTYVLSGKVHRSALPAMQARLGPGPAAVAFATDDSTPLLHASLEPNGFAKIGVTKYLTKILGNPWPGGDPDHAVVLEVEEQVF